MKKVARTSDLHYLMFLQQIEYLLQNKNLYKNGIHLQYLKILNPKYIEVSSSIATKLFSKGFCILVPKSGLVCLCPNNSFFILGLVIVHTQPFIYMRPLLANIQGPKIHLTGTFFLIFCSTMKAQGPFLLMKMPSFC